MIALDLDNTIICYERAFAAAANKLALDLSRDPRGKGKVAVKSAAFSAGGNALWTRIQGLAYGTEIGAARPFPGVKEFFAAASSKKVPLAIVSHKTRFSAAFPEVDLRGAALEWLEANTAIRASRTPIHFCDTREEKVRLLGKLGCTALLDDLPDVFRTPGFPSSTRFVLFDPDDKFGAWSESRRVDSWAQAAELLLTNG